MQWRAILVLAAAPLAACSVAAVATTTSIASIATKTGCKHHGGSRSGGKEAIAPTPSPQWPVFTWDGLGYTGSAPSGWFTINGKTLSPGGMVRVHKTLLMLASDVSAVTAEHKGRDSIIPVIMSSTLDQDDNQRDSQPAQQTGEPEGQQRPQPSPRSSTTSADDDCGTASVITSSQQQSTIDEVSSETTAAAITTTTPAFVQITSVTPLTGNGPSPTTAPVSSSTGAAQVQVRDASPWFGAAVAGIAWLLV